MKFLMCGILYCLLTYITEAHIQVKERKRRVHEEEYEGIMEHPPDYHNHTINIASRANIIGDDVTYVLYTKENPLIGEYMSHSSFLQRSAFFSPMRKSFFIIHGWKSDHHSDIIHLIKDAILAKLDANVFGVDWSYKSKSLYVVAKSNVDDVGKKIAKFMRGMMVYFNVHPNSISLIGHSLGAHISGIAGEGVGGNLNYIVGLDPAKPLFSLKHAATVLDMTDANFVQVIHTNGKLLGMKSAMGHADYYPNGGDWQPGCGVDTFGVCSHSRSYQYFAESILSGGFLAYPCDTYDHLQGGLCGRHNNSYLGTLEIDKRAFGDYFLRTNSTHPFALDPNEFI